MYNIILQQFPNLKKIFFIYVNRLTLQLAKVEETNWKNRDKSEGENIIVKWRETEGNIGNKRIETIKWFTETLLMNSLCANVSIYSTIGGSLIFIRALTLHSSEAHNQGSIVRKAPTSFMRGSREGRKRESFDHKTPNIEQNGSLI